MRRCWVDVGSMLGGFWADLGLIWGRFSVLGGSFAVLGWVLGGLGVAMGAQDRFLIDFGSVVRSVLKNLCQDAFKLCIGFRIDF